MMPERVIKTLDGKRGSFLLVGGVAYAFIGLSYVITVRPEREAAFSWLPTVITPHLVGIMWLLVGVCVAMSSLFSRNHRGLEPMAFSALMLCPSAFVVVFLVATFTGAHPDGWISAGVYCLMCLWVWIVAGWENPVGPVTRPAREEAPHE